MSPKGSRKRLLDPAASGARPVRTMGEIADLAGVSIASVSRALNGLPGVSASTRATILRIAEESSFVGNAAARALVSGRLGRVAVAVPFLQGDFLATIVAGVADVLYHHGVSLALATTAHDGLVDPGVVQKVLGGGVDGAIFLLPVGMGPLLEQLDKESLPTVVIDPVEDLGLSTPMVSAAHAVGARQAMAHLTDLGHTRIGLVTGEPDMLATTERLHGCRQALAAAGLPFDGELVRHRSYILIEDGYTAALELLAVENPPTAIFAFNDRLAFGALRAARERGLDVPGDLSIVGFDDLEAASLVSPGLTTVRPPLYKMGGVASDLLMRWIAGQGPDGMRVQLPTELVVRESTATPGGAAGTPDGAALDPMRFSA